MPEYTLQVEDRHGKLTVHPLDQFPFTIGRGPENKLVIGEPSVSRQHAYIRQVPEGLSIVDNESRNGVFVNNEKIFKVRLLNPGDTLRIGSAKLKLRHEGSPEIPLQSRGSETIQFFPSRDTWDSLKSLTASLPKQPSLRGTGPSGVQSGGPSWQWMLPRLFLDSPVEQIYEHILDMIEQTVRFDRCFIIQFDKGQPDQMDVVTKRSHQKLPTDFIVSKNILERVASSREAVTVAAEDTSYSPSQSFIKSGAATAICIPLIVGGIVTGVIYLDRVSSNRSFAQEDIEAIGPLAGLVGLKLENLRLLNDRVASQLLVRDLELAKVIQESLLPREPAGLTGYSLEGFSSPCRLVGGDYYDFFSHPDGTCTLVIGDVSGKGLSSAMYMACVRSTLHAHLEDGLELGQLMAKLERNIHKTFRPDHFLTLVLARLSPDLGTFRYCNAGHLPPLLWRPGGEVVELQVTAPALNIATWEDYTCQERTLAPGEILLLYTDGFLEAENPLGEQFGQGRLMDCLARHSEESLVQIRKELVAEIDAFGGDAPPSDDRTLILIRREKG